MVAELTILQPQPARIDDLIRAIQDDLVPAAAAQPGFCSVVLLTDVPSNSAIVMTFWRTEAAYTHVERSGRYRAALDQVRALLVKPPRRQSFEMSVRAALTPDGTVHIDGI